MGGWFLIILTQVSVMTANIEMKSSRDSGVVGGRQTNISPMVYIIIEQLQFKIHEIEAEPNHVVARMKVLLIGKQ